MLQDCVAVYLEMPAYVVYAIAAQTDDPQPAHQAARGRQGNESEPEPHERKDLLVEQIDWQDALDGVRVLAAHAAQLEVTQSHAREADLSRQRSLTQYEITHECHAVQVVLGAEKQVEYQQLDRQIQQVDCLHTHRRQLL